MRGDKSQRAWIYAIVGAYLLYTAWQLFQGLGESEGNQAVIAIFAVLFVIAGAALIWFSIRSMRKSSAQADGASKDNGRDENGEDNTESQNPADEDVRSDH